MLRGSFGGICDLKLANNCLELSVLGCMARVKCIEGEKSGRVIKECFILVQIIQCRNWIERIL